MSVWPCLLANAGYMLNEILEQSHMQAGRSPGAALRQQTQRQVANLRELQSFGVLEDTGNAHGKV